MKKIILIYLLFHSLWVQAEILKTAFYSAQALEDSQLIVKFTNGRIGYLSGDKKHLKNKISRLAENQMVEVELDKEMNLVAIYSLGLKQSKSFTDTPSLSLFRPDYSPTVLPTFSHAMTIFSRLNSSYGRLSECSNRAHIWAYEESKNHGIKSEKVYVFFTASYINRFRFKWWYHVAPLVSVQIGNSVEKLVLDYMFGHQPLSIKEWTDKFVFTQRTCKATSRFSEYDVNPQTEDCYLMIDTMYTWNPIDLSNQERSHYVKKEFSRSEIWAAYEQAF